MAGELRDQGAVEIRNAPYGILRKGNYVQRLTRARRIRGNIRHLLKGRETAGQRLPVDLIELRDLWDISQHNGEGELSTILNELGAKPVGQARKAQSAG